MRYFAAVLASVFVLGACAASSAPTATTEATATLTDTAISLSGTDFSAGTINLRVVNAGTVMHSLVLIKTNLAADKIPADAKEPAKADERGSVFSAGQIQAGETKTFVVPVTSGKYVLICNEPAHYIVGMHTAFAVK